VFDKVLDVHGGASVQSVNIERARTPIAPATARASTEGGTEMPYQRLHRRRAAAAIAAARLVAVTGCNRGGGPPPPPPPPGTEPGPGTPGNGHVPVIFVHGFGSSASQWTGVMNQFRAKGYASSELSAISYNSQVAIATSSQTLSAEVQKVLARTGAPRVDIVSHSMGSMVAKTCIIIGGCKGKVAHWESMSGVDNGTENEIIIARGTRSNEDVQGRTPLRKQLQDGWQDGIVARGVKVQVHWSRNDGIVVPGKTSIEPEPANNIEKPSLNHLNIYSDAVVIGEVVTFFGT
jgi:triacylglycerol lipase